MGLPIELFETVVDCRMPLAALLNEAVAGRAVNTWISPELTEANYPRTVAGVWRVQFGTAGAWRASRSSGLVSDWRSLGTS